MKRVTYGQTASRIPLGIFLGTMVLWAVLWYFRDSTLANSRYGYLGIFVINFVSSATIFFPAPGAASVFIGGSVWNPWLVAIVSACGATGGELFGYLLGWGGNSWYRQKRDRVWIDRLERLFQRAGFLTIFLYSALPIPLFDVVGVLAGSFNYPLWKFATATILGRLVKYGVLALAGRQLLPE